MNRLEGLEAALRTRADHITASLSEDRVRLLPIE